MRNPHLMDQISETVANIRKEPALAFANELGEISRFIPTDILSAAAQAMWRRPMSRHSSSVWIAGAHIERMYPLIATIVRQSTSRLTYNGTASVGVSSDDAAVADLDVLLEALRQGFSDAIGEHVPATTPISGEYRNRIRSVQTASSTAKPKSATAKKPSTRKKAPVATAAAKKAPAKKAPAKDRGEETGRRLSRRRLRLRRLSRRKKAPAKKTVAKVAAQRAAADKAVKRCEAGCRRRSCCQKRLSSALPRR
jgi:hypothetical protein